MNNTEKEKVIELVAADMARHKWVEAIVDAIKAKQKKEKTK